MNNLRCHYLNFNLKKYIFSFKNFHFSLDFEILKKLIMSSKKMSAFSAFLDDPKKGKKVT